MKEMRLPRGILEGGEVQENAMKYDGMLGRLCFSPKLENMFLEDCF